MHLLAFPEILRFALNDKRTEVDAFHTPLAPLKRGILIKQKTLRRFDQNVEAFYLKCLSVFVQAVFSLTNCCYPNLDPHPEGREFCFPAWE